MIFSIGHSTLSEEAFLEAIKSVDIVLDIRSHPTSRWPQFRKENMEQWLPKAGKKYEWEPGLGGWDTRHMSLQSQFQGKVDIADYSRGQFPKQIIASSRLDDSAILKQIAEGCSCCIPAGIAGQIASDISQAHEDPQLRPYLVCLMGQMKDDIRELKKPRTKRKYQGVTRGQALLGLTDSGRDVTRECSSCNRLVIAPQWLSKGLYDYSFFMALPEFHRAARELINLGQKVDVAICCCESVPWHCHRASICDYLHYANVESSHIMPSGKIKSHKSMIGNRLQRYHQDIIDMWHAWK